MIISFLTVTSAGKPNKAPDFSFKCNHCPVKTKDFIKLAAHHDLNHLNKDPDNEQPFKCGLCGLTFGQVLPLDSHCKAQDHKSLKSFCKLYVCGLCPCFAEDTRESLTEHFKTEHRDRLNVLDNKRRLPEPEPEQPPAAAAGNSWVIF